MKSLYKVVPITVRGTIKQLGLAVPPPPAANPQLYAVANYNCAVPNIPVYTPVVGRKQATRCI